jgi:hypothetical protein
MTKLRVIAGGVMLSVLALSGSAAAAAGNSTNQTTITYMEEDFNPAGASGSQTNVPYVFLQFAVKPNAFPACATTNFFMLDPNLPTEQFKAMVALLTSAYLAGKTVRVFTINTCSVTGNPGNMAIVDNITITSGT